MSARILYRVALADFLERVRSYRFLVVVGIVSAIAFMFVPSDDASYITMDLDGYRGVYNSAWVGGAVALLASLYLALVIFYVIKGSVSRDIDTGVGQIIASTPISKHVYILGKFLSNVVVLLVMVFVLIVVAGVMQLVRGEEMHIDWWPLVAPSLIIVVPVMTVVAAFALLFDTVPELRGGFGNVVFLFLFMMVLFPLGLRGSFILENMTEGVQEVVPRHSDRTSCCMMFRSQSEELLGRPDAPQMTFRWKGMKWTPLILLTRLIYIGSAAAIILMTALLFNRFDSSRTAFGKLAPLLHRIGLRVESLHSRLRNPFVKPSEELDIEFDASEHRAISLTPLEAKSNSFRFGAMLVAELRLMLKGLQWWWYLMAVGLIVTSFVVSSESAHRWLLPISWVWPVLLLSTMGVREAQFRTVQLIFSAPHPLRSQLPVIWVAGLIVVMLAGSGVLVRLLIDGNIDGALTWIVGALFIPSLALALGTWSGTSKLFQIVYLMLWYLGPMQRVHRFDFMGLEPGIAIAQGVPLIFGCAVLILLVLAFLGRKRQLV